MKKKTFLKKVSKLHNKCITILQLIDFSIYPIAYQCDLMFELFQSPKGKKIAKDEDGKNNAAIGAAPTSATSDTENAHKHTEGLVRKIQSYRIIINIMLLI